MSDFNPTKQSFYRGNSNKSPRKTQRNGGNASNGFDFKSITKTPSKYTSSISVPQFQENQQISKSMNQGSPSVYSKRSSYKSSYNYGTSEKNRRVNNTISEVKPSSTEIFKIKGDNNFTDTEDSKTMKSTPNGFRKQRKISRKNIRRLNEKSIPRPPDFR